MDNNTQNTAPTTPEREFHLVCSSGGSRAILASAGVLLACEQAGIKKFKSIGGISGGSIPTALFATGMNAAECVRTAMEIDFASLLTRRASFLRILLAYFMQRRNEKVRPVHGVLTSEKLGVFIESFMEGKAQPWPEGYWTMAIADKSEIIFTGNGVFEVVDGQLRVLSCDPGPLGIAIRGSCAVPGIISAVEYRSRYLFDGVLGDEGRAPFSVPIKLYGAKRTDVIVCDVGDDNSTTSQRITKIWTMICGEDCVPAVNEPQFHKEPGLIIVQPTLSGFRSLQFSLTADIKWRAIMSGYRDTIPELAAAGILTGDKLLKAQEVCTEYAAVLEGHQLLPKGELSRQVEALLQKHGLL